MKDVGSYLTEQAMQILDIDQMLVCHLRGVVERRGIEVLIETFEGNSPFNCSAQAEVSLVKKCLHNINFSKCALKLGDPLGWFTNFFSVYIYRERETETETERQREWSNG